MKTDRQIGSKRPHSGKPAVGSPRAPRRASSPRYALLAPTGASRRRSLARFEDIRGGPLAADFACPPSDEPLIANLELEFSSTHRKHSPLIIPNRKFSRAFHPDAAQNSRLLVTQYPSSVTPFLIHGSAIKSPANPQGFNNVQFSNRR